MRFAAASTPIRNGILDVLRSVSGVLTKPGHTTCTSTPSRASGVRIDSANTINADFDAQ